ncbi:hypothetical protein DUI87_08193 [Hirundo rustica rustica]|uniref:ribonuclease H n=1 Tax=Hirundo rustica rustica TaxID=333673 RepID=A0A3M0KSU2_HIRRU|nr:hypothetical protein DUI87_08193 [Hirundo rustica rustica]
MRPRRQAQVVQGNDGGDGKANLAEWVTRVYWSPGVGPPDLQETAQAEPPQAACQHLLFGVEQEEEARGWKCTLLGRVQFLLYQDPKDLQSTAALNPFIRWPVLIPGVATTQLPHLALILVKPHEIYKLKEPDGPFQPYSKIKQLPSEPFVTFVESLTRAIELQVKNEGAQEQVLEEMALTNANEQCKAAILSLPLEPAPTLDDMLQAAATEEHPTQKPNWKTDSPVWIEQWPLSKEKLKVLQELVDEQLAKGHIVETTSPWNSPVFVIKKANKGKWRLLHDLRQINNVIEDMGSLQPGMPSPVMLPQNWNLAIIDIKDCFFQTPLHPDDAPHFTFTVPTLNWEAPRKRYHWKFLPQGMKNSPSICQWYLSSLLSPVRAAVGEAIILHYMDDVLVCAPNDDLLSHALDLTIDSLVAAGFELQEEKIQRMPPWKYLGLEIGEKSSDAMKHLIQAFSFLGIPKSIKTDNGPTYTSKEFRSFLQQWGVEHKTGNPYSPTGQAIVERTHQNLKRVLSQQHQSLKLETPQIQLSKALFTLNFLNCTFENFNPPIVRHFRENCQLQLKAKPPVMVKDPATKETGSS